MSRFEVVRQRIKQKELASSNRMVVENRIADSSSKSTSTGLLVSVESRFEALRHRVMMKELRAKGELLVDG